MLHVVMFMTLPTKGQKTKQYESNTSRHNKCFPEKKLSYLKIQIHDLTVQSKHKTNAKLVTNKFTAC